MKIRTGFVSNSSSSSFCILGVALTLDQEYEDMLEELEEKIENTNLQFSLGLEDYYEMIIVGLNPRALDENKTILQHKKEISEEINKAFDSNYSEKDIEFHIDGGFLG